MTTKPEKTHCARCGRSVKPRWKLVSGFIVVRNKIVTKAQGDTEKDLFVGSTCRRKWIEAGEYCAEDFVDTKEKVRK